MPQLINSQQIAQLGMQLGAMNNPAKDVYAEVGWIADRFDFVDLTL